MGLNPSLSLHDTSQNLTLSLRWELDTKSQLTLYAEVLDGRKGTKHEGHSKLKQVRASSSVKYKQADSESLFIALTKLCSTPSLSLTTTTNKPSTEPKEQGKKATRFDTELW